MTTRNESEVFCKSHNAHLVRIDDSYENAFLLSRFPLAGGNLSSAGHMWIGFNDMQTEGLYVWTDGQPVTFTSWRKNEPNDVGHEEDCVELYISPTDRLINGAWNDISCSKKRGWICEKQSGLLCLSMVCCSRCNNACLLYFKAIPLLLHYTLQLYVTTLRIR